MPSLTTLLGFCSEYGEPHTRKFPVFMDHLEIALCAVSRDHIYEALRKLGVGRGVVMDQQTSHDGFVFYPPDWRGPCWTPALDTQWRGLEVLATYEQRKLDRSMRRYKMLTTARGRPLPRTLLSNA